ncbi:MAG: GHKL domain-containing protein [Sporomusaceae bacterium]|nr:GHKL domain-containing protein [Sporomusaceae bacterium]
MKKYIQVALSGESTTFTQYSDHQHKWYSIYAYSPQHGYVVEISEDITERKEQEAKADRYVAALSERNRDLNTSQSRYRDLLDHMHNIFQYHRVIADENGQAVDLEFAEVNPAFEMWTGLKIADVVGRRLPLVAHGIDKAYWIQVLGNVALTRQPIVLEKYLENTDTWYKVSAYSPENGYVASILEDITEQKKAEVQKNAAQRQAALIERVASLGALAAGVAHEINQPLQALKIMADGMVYWYDKGKEPNIEKIIENCRYISVQAGYITAIVEWMQDSANRAWSDTPEDVDLNKVIQQALNMVQERLRVHSIQLREMTCMTSLKVWGDIRRLEEIVIIILANAIDSLNCVDQITKEIVITTSCVEGRAIVEISNNGPAIPDEIIGKIFEPFFSFSRSDNKLGMGLAITKSIVNAHNGTIQASNFNQQVTFRIDFPLYEQ